MARRLLLGPLQTDLEGFEMRRKNTAALPLAILLLLDSIFGGYSSAGTVSRPSEAEAPPLAETRPAGEAAAGRTAEDARFVAALPRVRRIGGAADASRTGGAGVFQLQLAAAPEAISRAFLVYELAGVPHW